MAFFRKFCSGGGFVSFSTIITLLTLVFGFLNVILLIMIKIINVESNITKNNFIKD